MMHPGFAETIETLRNDSLSSSSEMVRSAIDRILAYGSANEQEWLEFGAALISVRPYMAPFFNLGTAVKEAAPRGTLAVHTAVSSLAQKEKDAPSLIAEQVRCLPGHVFITLSYSGTVMQCLLELAKTREMRVIVLRSLPLGEGEMTCSKLLVNGVKVEMVDDSMAFSAMAEADHCLVGADAVTSEGVVNKVGTANLALAARQLGKGCHVLTSTLKVAPIKEHDLMLSEESGPCLRRHQVFELTPLPLFTDLMTDEGTLSPAEMAQLLR
jgi:translation initiation factor eIF-2B subunit delta